MRNDFFVSGSEEKIRVEPVAKSYKRKRVWTRHRGETPVVRTQISYSARPVSLLKAAFLKIILLHQKRKYQSELIRSDPQSDPIQAIRSWFC